MPSPREVFISDAVERGVVTILEEEYMVTDVGKAECPDYQPVEPGTSFTCAVDVGGKQKSVEITVVSADGEYEVGQPR